jgi:hypothetical protein
MVSESEREKVKFLLPHTNDGGKEGGGRGGWREIKKLRVKGSKRASERRKIYGNLNRILCFVRASEGVGERGGGREKFKYTFKINSFACVIGSEGAKICHLCK